MVASALTVVSNTTTAAEGYIDTPCYEEGCVTREAVQQRGIMPIAGLVGSGGVSHPIAAPPPVCSTFMPSTSAAV